MFSFFRRKSHAAVRSTGCCCDGGKNFSAFHVEGNEKIAINETNTQELKHVKATDVLEAPETPRQSGEGRKKMTCCG